MLDRIKTFLQDAHVEFRHINWPTRAEAVRLTTVVIGISLGLAAFLGFFDFIFTYLLKLLVENP